MQASLAINKNPKISLHCSTDVVLRTLNPVGAPSIAICLVLMTVNGKRHVVSPCMTQVNIDLQSLDSLYWWTYVSKTHRE